MKLYFNNTVINDLKWHIIGKTKVVQLIKSQIEHQLIGKNADTFAYKDIEVNINPDDVQIELLNTDNETEAYFACHVPVNIKMRLVDYDNNALNLNIDILRSGQNYKDIMYVSFNEYGTLEVHTTSEVTSKDLINHSENVVVRALNLTTFNTAEDLLNSWLEHRVLSLSTVINIQEDVNFTEYLSSSTDLNVRALQMAQF